MSEALYRKWRPRLWEGVVGQDHIVQTLKNAVRGGRIGHAYLFSGPRGTGKTTTARLLAKAVNCLDDDTGNRPCDTCDHCLAVNNNRFMDLIEIDAASNTSVDDIRALREKIGFSPSQGRFKVYIIDEVHMLSTAAFNALLKTLEEPPVHAIFVLATTEVHKIPATVLSRCQRHEFRRIPVNTIVKLLKDLSVNEKIKVDDDSLTLIARQSTGAMRDAISLLDQLSSTGERITLERAQEVLGTATNQSVIDLVNAILTNKTADGLDCLHNALDNGSDPRQFARQVVEYLRSLLLIRMENPGLIEGTQEVRAIMARQASQFKTPVLIEAVRLFNNAANESRLAWQPSLALELALATVLNIPDEQPEEKIVVSKPGASINNENSKQSAKEEEDLKAVFEPKQKQKKADVLDKPVIKEETLQPDPEPETEVKSKPGAEVESEPESETESEPESEPESESDLTAEAKENEKTPIAADGLIHIQMVHDALPEIKTLIRKYRKNTEALLASARGYSVKKGVIVIAFQSPVLKERLEKGDHQEIIQRAFSHVLGMDVQVRAVVSNSKDTIIDQEHDIENSPLVNAAIELGGKIVDKE